MGEELARLGSDATKPGQTYPSSLSATVHVFPSLSMQSFYSLLITDRVMKTFAAFVEYN